MDDLARNHTGSMELYEEVTSGLEPLLLQEVGRLRELEEDQVRSMCGNWEADREATLNELGLSSENAGVLIKFIGDVARRRVAEVLEMEEDEITNSMDHDASDLVQDGLVDPDGDDDESASLISYAEACGAYDFTAPETLGRCLEACKQIIWDLLLENPKSN